MMPTNKELLHLAKIEVLIDEIEEIARECQYPGKAKKLRVAKASLLTGLGSLRIAIQEQQ